MQAKRNHKRAYGTGSVEPKGNSWLGRWRVAGKPVKRSLGPIKSKDRPDGLTRTQAEARLREKMAEYKPAGEEVTVPTFAVAGTRHINRLKVMGRKRSTTEEYESCKRIHLDPEFGDRPVDAPDHHDVERLQQKLLRTLSRKTVKNYMSILSGVFTHARKEGWRTDNPVSIVDKPKVDLDDEDFNHLDLADLEALIRAVPNDCWGKLEGTLYRFAAMTGMREGECLGIRWKHIDWIAMRVRVNKNFVRGEDTNTKSRKNRSVPMADQVATVLERHFQRSAYQGPNDRVFGHPETGMPLDRSKLLKRFKAAIVRAEIGEVEMRIYKTRKGAKDKARPYTAYTFHDLRHTFGTMMAANPKVSLRLLQEWMGHDDIKTTQRYTHYSPAEQEALLISEAFKGAEIPTDPGILLEGAAKAPAR